MSKTVREIPLHFQSQQFVEASVDAVFLNVLVPNPSQLILATFTDSAPLQTMGHDIRMIRGEELLPESPEGVYTYLGSAVRPAQSDVGPNGPIMLPPMMVHFFRFIPAPPES
jgi:hypothetical protein